MKQQQPSDNEAPACLGGTLQLEALPAVPDAGAVPSGCGRATGSPASNELKASEPETEREKSPFAGFSSTEVKVTITS